ncbi:hypothetical protein [Actinoplanes sp. NPDC049118]
MKRASGSDIERAIRDTAVRESWAYNDPRATYDLAARARTAQAEGRERAR